jgi:hypothetical protein
VRFVQIPYDLAGAPLGEWKNNAAMMEAYHVAAINFQLAQVLPAAACKWFSRYTCVGPAAKWHSLHCALCPDDVPPLQIWYGWSLAALLNRTFIIPKVRSAVEFSAFMPVLASKGAGSSWSEPSIVE